MQQNISHKEQQNSDSVTGDFWKEVKIDDDGDNSPENILRICESSNFKLGNAGRIYDCSVILAKYLLKQNEEGNLRLKGKKVLELGCGTGCLSIFIASIGMNVVATDLEVVQGLVSKNIEANQEAIKQRGGSVEFASLDWNWSEEKRNEVLEKQLKGEKIDYILAADVCFNSNIISPFFKTLSQLRNHLKDEGEIFLSYKLRLHKEVNEDPILDSFREWKFEGERVHKSELDSKYIQQDVEIFRLS